MTLPGKRHIALSRLHWRHLHGLGGAVFVLACLLELVLFTLRGTSTPALVGLIVVSSLPFGAGIFTRSFRRRLTRLGPRRFIFYRALAWLYAFLGLSCSVYAQPVLRFEDTGWTTWSFSVIFAFFSLVSLAIAVVEWSRMTLFTDGFLIANATSIAMLACMPLLHWAVGTDQLAAWYTHYSVGDAIYLLCILTGLIASLDTFVLGLVTSRRAYYEQYRKSSGILWGGCFMTGSFLILGLLISWTVALLYFVPVMLAHAAGSLVRFPIEENQRGLLGREAVARR